MYIHTDGRRHILTCIQRMWWCSLTGVIRTCSLENTDAAWGCSLGLSEAFCGGRNSCLESQNLREKHKQGWINKGWDKPSLFKLEHECDGTWSHCRGPCSKSRVTLIPRSENIVEDCRGEKDNSHFNYGSDDNNNDEIMWPTNDHNGRASQQSE